MLLPTSTVYRSIYPKTPYKSKWGLEQARALLGGPLRVLSFDCTTLYFESFTEDELKQPGYSKDAKFKECQVLLTGIRNL